MKAGMKINYWHSITGSNCVAFHRDGRQTGAARIYHPGDKSQDRLSKAVHVAVLDGKAELSPWYGSPGWVATMLGDEPEPEPNYIILGSGNSWVCLQEHGNLPVCVTPEYCPICARERFDGRDLDAGSGPCEHKDLIGGGE